MKCVGLRELSGRLFATNFNTIMSEEVNNETVEETVEEVKEEVQADSEDGELKVEEESAE